MALPIWLTLLVMAIVGAVDINDAVAAERVGNPEILPDMKVGSEVVVVKCCPKDSFMVETRFEMRQCIPKDKLQLYVPDTEWMPSFHSLQPPHNEVIGPRNYTVDVHIPHVIPL